MRVNHFLLPFFQRHFAVFALPGPVEDSLKSVVNSILEASMTQNDHPGLDIELHNGIVQASVKVLTAVKNVLKPSPMPGRSHYCFTLKGIVKCFQVRARSCMIYMYLVFNRIFT